MSRQSILLGVVLTVAAMASLGCRPQQPGYLFEDGDLSHYVGVATQIEYPDVNVESLPDAVGAGAPADEWHSFQTRFNTKLLEVYGMTECYCCLASPYDAPRAGSCGQAITGWDVRIVDDDDNECPPGTPGEFVARSNKMFVGTTGYYKKPEATLDLFQNGWIHTGDLGRMDEDGYFYFLDRKKQAIRRRGENISSFEVEAEEYDRGADLIERGERA